LVVLVYVWQGKGRGTTKMTIGGCAPERRCTVK
jgi:hypothetical protein